MSGLSSPVETHGIPQAAETDISAEQDIEAFSLKHEKSLNIYSITRT